MRRPLQFTHYHVQLCFNHDPPIFSGQLAVKSHLDCVERLHAVCKMYSWWWVLIFSLWSWSFPTAVFPGIYLTKNTSTSRNSAFYFSCTIVVKINEINIRPWIRDLKAYIFLLGTVHKHLLGGPMREKKKGGALKFVDPRPKKIITNFPVKLNLQDFFNGVNP